MNDEFLKNVIYDLKVILAELEEAKVYKQHYKLQEILKTIEFYRKNKDELDECNY